MEQYGQPIFGTVTETSLIVDTTFGRVRGENREGIAISRGIPYGGKVVEKNRFQSPTSSEPWTDV